jgi:hypothetical protein
MIEKTGDTYGIPPEYRPKVKDFDAAERRREARERPRFRQPA